MIVLDPVWNGLAVSLIFWVMIATILTLVVTPLMYWKHLKIILGELMAYSMGDLKKGLRIELEGIPYRITEYQHVKPGKGAAFVRAKIKSLIDGKVIEKLSMPATRQMSRILSREL